MMKKSSRQDIDFCNKSRETVIIIAHIYQAVWVGYGAKEFYMDCLMRKDTVVISIVQMNKLKLRDIKLLYKIM